MTLQQIIHEKITRALSPTHLEVINDSHKHAGHVGAGEETHFRVIISSPLFAGQTTLACHRMVYGVLAEEMHETIHALAIEVRK